MSSQVRRLIENTRERLISSDINDIQALAHRAMIEMGAALLIGDLFGAATPASGVLGGFLVDTNNPVSMLLSVSPGIALLYQSPTPSTLDSEFVWLEMIAAASLDLTADVPGGAGETAWIVVEVAPADVLELSDLRDIWNPALSTFSPVNVSKLRGSAPLLRTRSGTATTGTALLPAGVTGYIPLAYVLLAFGDTTIVDAAVVRCRPLLDAQKHATQQTVIEAGQSSFVTGGGLSTSDPFATGNAVEIHDCRAILNGIPARCSGGLNLDSRTYETGQTFGADVDSVSTPVYVYMIAPPFPTGYDPLAPRELAFLLWEKNILSTGGGGGNAMSALGVEDGYARNCLTMISTTGPEGIVGDHRNTRGPHPDTDTGLVIATGTPWGAAATTVDSVYVGACSHSTASPNASLGQEYLGAGICKWASQTQAERPLVDYTANQGASDHAPFEYPDPSAGTDPDIAPSTADMAWMQLGSTDGASAVAGVEVAEQSATGTHGDSGDNGLRAAIGFSYTSQAWMRVNPANRSLTVTVTGYTTGDHYLATLGYRDRILAGR